MIEWEKITKDEHEMITRIVDRLIPMAEDFGIKRDRVSWHMDMEAAHLSCQLDLQRLLTFDDGNFGHDVFGIYRHLNRVTGEMQDCFLPRCTAH
jgi:hypothetical protein